MKKIFFSISIASSFILGSCGKSACDCKKEALELINKASTVGTDAEKVKEFEKEAEELEKSCKDFTEADYKDCK